MGLFPLDSSRRKKLRKIASNPSSILPLVGGGLVSALIGKGPSSIGDILPYVVARKIFPVTTRVKLPDIMMEAAAKQFAGTLGKNLAESLTPTSLLSGLASVGGVKKDNIVENLMRTDDIIKKADKNLIISAYETMKSVAPTLAKDINAVRSFLREVAMAGTGPDYNTIRQLADTEKTIRQSLGGIK
ncbi:MAG: hypothetical protein ABIM30_00320 [candidate division WOR-3 bacterium]